MHHGTLRWGMLHTAAEGETATKVNNEGVGGLGFFAKGKFFN